MRGLRPDLEITGFETAFSEIAPRLVERGHDITIYCRANAHSAARRVPREDGVRLVYMPAPGGKNLSALASTGLAVVHALAARQFDVWFFVNVGMGHHAALARLSGKPVVMNVDGLDWQRGKWGPVARTYFQSAARSAVRYCTRLVTDADAMRAYYRDHFGADSEMIAYGAEVCVSERPELLRAIDATPREYFLIVSRLIPENSLEAMLEGFQRSRTTKQLIVVGGANYRDAFHARLRDIAAADARIRLVGHVADQTLLTELWCNCYAYLHGHSVGGTNPALLRAMGCGSAVLARDTVFNREVLGETGKFFAHEPEAVRSMVDAIDGAPHEAAALRDLAPRRVLERYTWEQIAAAYDRVFRSVAGAR
ncbi:MAG: glycosyltransferase [bacterium]